MKRHLTERDLIEYEFKLAADRQMREIAGHLEGCAACSERLEQLRGKFAALELLREEAAVSEDLISRVVQQAGQPVGRRQARVIRFYGPAWAGAAAAVLLIGVLLVVGRFGGRETTKQYEYADRSAGPKVAIQIKPEEQTRGRATVDLGVSDGIAAGTTLARFRHGIAGAEGSSEVVMDDFLAEAIPEQAPFAPASAIELVVLPRRENVQLTIYNATFQTLTMFGGYGGYGGGTGGYGGGYGGYGVKLDEATRKALEEAIKRAPSIQIPSSVPGGDVTLVRERRNLTLKRGWNWLQFMWANTLIDPTSLSLEPLEQADKIDIQQLVFPARLRELGRWLIRSEVSGQVPFEITYFTSGLSWRAFYVGTLSQSEETMNLQGYVRVTNNSGEDYENAQTRLIVGQVHILDKIAELAKRQYPYGSPIPEPGAGYGGYGFGGYGGGLYLDANFKAPVLANASLLGAFFEGEQLDRKEITKEGLSEYFLYTIEGTETIADKWGKRLLSLDVNDIKVKSLYKYDEERWGQQAIRFVAFANDDEHNLGETPIPDGTVKIYSQADEQGHLSYVGATDVKYIPVNEEVELNLGLARLVKVEPTLMEFGTENYEYDKEGNIAGWDEIRTWKIEITNTRTLAIEIEITRGFGTAYWKLQTDTAYEKYDATHARFKLNVQPRTKQTVSYKVTTYHGVREEKWQELAR